MHVSKTSQMSERQVRRKDCNILEHTAWNVPKPKIQLAESHVSASTKFVIRNERDLDADYSKIDRAC